MAENSKIEWCDHTFNPWIGCSKVHAGCEHCYAEADQDKRRGRVKWGSRGTRSVTSADYWKQPLKWNARCDREHFVQCCGCGQRSFFKTEQIETFCDNCGDPEGKAVRPRVFCCSLSDVFEDWAGTIIDHSGMLCHVGRDGRIVRGNEDGDEGHAVYATMDDLRRQLFSLIDATRQLDWLLLTKRPQNIQRMWVDQTHRIDPEPYRENVQLGTSVSDQSTADKMIPELLTCRDLSPVLFASAEPLLGPIDFDQKPSKNGRLDGVIFGGESGPNARTCDVSWILDGVSQCQSSGIAAFVKQLGDAAVSEQSLSINAAKGGNMAEWPAGLQVRELPCAQ